MYIFSQGWKRQVVSPKVRFLRRRELLRALPRDGRGGCWGLEYSASFGGLQDLSNRISVEAFDRDKTAREAMPLISSLRAASLDVVDAVLKWREVVSDPQAIYLWKGTSYLKKMQDDVAFVAGSQIAAVLDCDANNNPFFYTRPPRERAAHDPASQAQRDASGAHSGLVLPHAAYPRVPYEQLLGTHPAIDARPMSASKRRLPPVKQRRGDTTHADACSSRIAAAERALRDEVRLLALGQPSGSGTRPGSAPLARGGGSSCATAERGQRRQTQRGDAEADGELESLRDPDSLTETLVQQRALEHRAATQIQSCWRASCERELLGVKALQKRAAIRIQRLARGYLAKREVTQRLRRHNAARRIQAGARGMLVRSAVSHLLLEHVAATQIQSAWRGCRGRKIARQRLLRRRGATDIQQVWRGYYARSRLDAVDQAKRRWAAAAIQGVWRGARVRAQPEFDARKIRAAIRIQAWWRGLLAREYHRWLRHRRDAGVHLQSWWRGLLARSYVNGLRDAEQEKDYRAFLRHADRRALDIQRVWRGHCARKTASGKGRS